MIEAVPFPMNRTLFFVGAFKTTSKKKLPSLTNVQFMPINHKLEPAFGDISPINIDLINTPMLEAKRILKVWVDSLDLKKLTGKTRKRPGRRATLLTADWFKCQQAVYDFMGYQTIINSRIQPVFDSIFQQRNTRDVWSLYKSCVDMLWYAGYTESELEEMADLDDDFMYRFRELRSTNLVQHRDTLAMEAVLKIFGLTPFSKENTFAPCMDILALYKGILEFMHTHIFDNQRV